MTGTVPRLTRRRLAQQEAGEEPTEDLRIPQVKRKPKVKAKAKAPARLVKTKPAKRSAAKTASGLAGAESRPVAAGGTSAPVKDKKRRRNVAEVTTAGSRVQFSVEQNENSQESEVVSPVSTPKVVKDHSDAPQAPFTPQQRQMHRSSAGHTPPPTRMLGARRPPEPVGLESELPCLFAEGGGFQKARSATYPCYPEDPPTPPPFVREGFSDSVTEDSSYYHHWLFSAPCAEEGSTPKSVTPVEDVPPDSLVSIRSGHSDDASPVDEQRCRTRSLEQAHCVRRSVGRTPPPARLSQESERGTGDSLDEMTLRQVQEDALDSQPGRSSTRRSVSQPRLDGEFGELR
ncbi:MAG: uncharacterized protein KVP18_000154 [Porospora cf. gigantea A]|uniref:uncharacterized protein n=1 Tax=Porospora cf. gigantea A TaxID=2853593 RepID=UPI0035598798|nr:MAG: hypothetical protein KVP18_000154 [Porospora cf. gigantea A]